MARIRTIKPEFFTSEDIVGLSPMARLLYIALWCEADREGRMAWKPRTFKMRYLPADDVDVDALCGELVKAGLVVLYGDGLAYIPKFSAHQHINPRESASSYPQPDASARVKHARPRVSDAQVGREGKGKEVITPPPPLQGGAFAKFWEAWPRHKRKVGREQCEAKWRTKGCDAIAERVMASLAAHKASEDWAKQGGEFIPSPLVWLNQARWEATTDAEIREAEWYSTRPGTDEMAQRLGMPKWDECIPWPVFRDRVLEKFHAANELEAA